MTMSRRGPYPTTPLSAAMTLLDWASAEGHLPRWADCAGSGGLLHRSTYYKIFCASTWSAMLAMAIAVVEGHLPPAPAPPPRQMKPCYNAPGCPILIVDEGPGVRFCRACRKRRAVTQETYDEAYSLPLFSLRLVQRYGVGRDGWDEDVDWRE